MVYLPFIGICAAFGAGRKIALNRCFLAILGVFFSGSGEMEQVLRLASINYQKGLFAAAPNEFGALG